MPVPIIAAIIGAAGSVAGGALAKSAANKTASQSMGTIEDARKRVEGKNMMIPVIKRTYNTPPAGYRPGIDPLWNMYTDQITGYRDLAAPMTPSSWNAAASGSTGFASGGAVDEETTPEEMKASSVVAEAMAALRGRSARPREAINSFIEYFGPEEFHEFRQEVLGGKQSQPPSGGGIVRGPGGGMDDMLPAGHPTKKILLSDGEFVVPADVVSHLGDGSTDAGARQLHAMMDRVRSAKTGTKAQPGKVSKKVLPA